MIRDKSAGLNGWNLEIARKAAQRVAIGTVHKLIESEHALRNIDASFYY